MPVSATKAANDRKARPNSLSRRDRTRKEGKCQLCETKATLKDQYVVTNDLEAGTVKASKDASKPSREKMSHYCGDCKDKRIAQKQAWLDSRDGAAKPKGKTKKAAKGKAKPKKAAKPKGKKAVKKPGKKGVKKPKGKKAGQPF
jgi:hypothetical protein